MSAGWKLAKAYGRGTALSLVISLGLSVLFFGGLCVVPVVAGFISEDLVAPAFWACFLSIPLIAMPSMIGGILLWRLGTNRRLDRMLADVGPGSMWMLSGRQWNGTYDGRAVHADMLRGPRFTLKLSGEPKSTLRIGRTNALARAVGNAMSKEPIEVGDGLIGFTEDDQGLWKDPAILEAAQQLLEEDGNSIRNLAIEPGKGVTLTMLYVRLGTLEEVPRWLAAMQTILEQAES